MSLLNPKFSISIYNDRYDFKGEPYTVNNSFSVLVGKERENLVDKLKNSQLRPQTAVCKTSEGFSVSTPFRTLNQGDPIGHSEPRLVDLAPKRETPKSRQSVTPSSNSQFRVKNARFGSRPQTTQSQLLSKSGGIFSNTRGPETSKRKIIRVKATEEFLKQKKFKDTIFFNERTQSIPKTGFQNKVINEIIDAQKDLEKSPLMERIMKLKKIDALKPQKEKIANMGYGNQFQYIYNVKWFCLLLNGDLSGNRTII